MYTISSNINLLSRFTRLQRKIISGMSILYYFTTHDFRFETKKLQELYSQLESDDQEKFYFDHTKINWEKHHDLGIWKIRTFLLQDDDSTIPKAQEKLRKLYWADWIVKIVLCTVMMWYSFKIFNGFVSVV